MTPEDRMRELGSRDTETPSEAEWLAFRARGHRSVRNRRIAGALGSVGMVAAIAIGAYLVGTNGRQPVDLGGSPTESPTSDGEEPRSDNVVVQQWFVEGEKLTVFHATLDDDGDPLRAALATLLQGVPGPLAESGVTTLIPDGTAIEDVAVFNGTAEVTLAGDFPDESDVQQDLAQAQLVYTVTQFPGIEKVTLSWLQPGSSGVAAGGSQNREKYHDYLQSIVVETPYPGEAIDGTTFTLSGIANVFEANVSWRIVDAEGNVVQEGFTTATCGTGCWGTFEDKIKYKGADDYAVLEVYESSAEDGTQLWLQEIPLNFN